MANKPSSTNNPMKKLLPRVTPEQASVVESADIVNQYLADYMDQLSLGKSGIVGFFELVRSQWRLNKNLLAASELNLDGNFANLEKRSKNFSNIITDLSAKIAVLEKKNAGLSFKDNHGGLFDQIAKKYKVWQDGIENVFTSDRMENSARLDATGRERNIDGKFVKAPKANAEETKEQRDRKETDKNANKFYKSFMNWFSLEKAKTAIQSTRKEAKEGSDKFNGFVTKAGKFLTSSLDNILDLPMLLTKGIGNFIGGFTKMFGTGLSMALVLGRKLLFSKIGVIAAVGTYLFKGQIGEYIGTFLSSVFSEDNLKRMKGVYDTIFSEDNIKKVMTAINGINWENTLLGATVGAKLAGPLGAVLGAVFGHTLEDALKITLPEIEEKIKKIGERRDEIQKTLNAQIDGITGTQKQLDEAILANNVAERERLEKRLDAELASKRSAEIALDVAKLSEEKAIRDKQNIEGGGFWGRILNGVDDGMRFIADSAVKAITLGSVSDLDTAWAGAKQVAKSIVNPTQRDIDWGTRYGMENADQTDNIYLKNSGVKPQPSKLAPGNGVLARETEKSARLQVMEKQREAMETMRRERALAMINAPTTNSRSTVVQNNNSSTVQMRASPIDAMLRNSPVTAW